MPDRFSPGSFNMTQDGSEAKLLSGSLQGDLAGFRRCQSSPLSWFVSAWTRGVGGGQPTKRSPYSRDLIYTTDGRDYNVISLDHFWVKGSDELLIPRRYKDTSSCFVQFQFQKFRIMVTRLPSILVARQARANTVMKIWHFLTILSSTQTEIGWLKWQKELLARPDEAYEAVLGECVHIAELQMLPSPGATGREVHLYEQMHDCLVVWFMMASERLWLEKCRNGRNGDWRYRLGK